MGVDVNLYAIVAVDDEAFAVAEAFCAERLPEWCGDGYGLKRDEYEPARIEWDNLSRFWGPGYERGPWPTIYGAIRVLKAAFPNGEVFYGGDSSDDGLRVTDELMAEYWAHFLSSHGTDYHKRWEDSRA